MAVPISSPAQNKVGERFAPLPSAERAIADRFDAVELFASRVPPGVLANEIPVLARPTRWPAAFAGAPTDLQQVLQLTLQVPQPVALVLGAWVPLLDRWRPPTRLSAVQELVPGAVPNPSTGEGRFVVEWGTGPARNYVFCDFAPGSLQLPVCQFVRVFVHLYRAGLPPGAGPQAIASASAYPGRQHPAPNATYTAAILQRAGDPSADATLLDVVPPYARSMTHTIAQDASPVTAWSAFRILDGTTFTPTLSSVLQAPQLVAPFVVTAQDMPYAVRACPLPGNAQFFQLDLATLVPATSAGASAVFEVRL